MDAPSILCASVALTCKAAEPAADDTPRLLRGIASTPRLDRHGDKLEPLGARFSLPLPLLAHHDSRRPVGLVTKATVTDEAIEIEAELPPKSAGIGRVEEIWQDLKAGLIRSFSVGLIPLEFSWMKDGGLHVTAWDWAELSVVTMPSNVDAGISMVRTLEPLDRSGPPPAPVVNSLPPLYPHRTRAGVVLRRLQAELITRS